MSKLFISISLVLVWLSLTGCATYHLSTQSLLEQFANTQKEKKLLIFIAPPFFVYPGVVEGNNLRTITVLDKNEHEHTIPLTRSTGVRITKKDGKKTTFYFNTLLLKDSTITGSKTHFFTARIRPIYFADIAKIQLQK